MAWLAGLGAAAPAETAVFQEGVSDAAGPNPAYEMDFAPLNSGCAGCSYTAEEAYCSVGIENGAPQRAVLRWPVTSLAGRVDESVGFTGARLRLYAWEILSGASLPPGAALELYRIAPDNAGWSEGDDAQFSTDNGGATWAFWRNNPAVAWAGGAPGLTIGVDTDPLPLAIVPMPGGGGAPRVLEFDIPNPNATLTPWVLSHENNHGFLLRASFDEGPWTGGQWLAVRLADDATTGGTARVISPYRAAVFRPILEVDYQPGSGVPVELAAFGAE